MFTLDARSRAALVGAALLAFAAAVTRDPIAARSAPPTLVRAPHVPLPSPPPFVAVLPHRDPFDGEPQPIGTPHGTPAAMPAIPATIGLLPPNAAVAGGTPAPRVTAIVSGAHPYALVETTGRTRVVTIGERVAGASIVAIGIDGVRLSDGKTLTIGTASTSASTAFAAPASPGVISGVPTVPPPPPRPTMPPGGSP
jgi:hypothetical protein